MQVECIPSSDAISVYATEMNKFLDDMYKSLLGDSSRIHTHDRIMFSLANAPVNKSYSLLKDDVILKASLSGPDSSCNLERSSWVERLSQVREHTHLLYSFYTPKVAPVSQKVQFFLLTNDSHIQSSILKSHNPEPSAHHDRPKLGSRLSVAIWEYLHHHTALLNRTS